MLQRELASSQTQSAYLHSAFAIVFDSTASALLANSVPMVVLGGRNVKAAFLLKLRLACVRYDLCMCMCRAVRNISLAQRRYK